MAANCSIMWERPWIVEGPSELSVSLFE